ncbi:MAG: Short-chain dehydrogenase/reductase [Conexibacter sp.]|nr:Short-chain dehydrogenase/reductase [Conexibacter sp.]
MTECDNKVALITGASRGIGAALVTAYRVRGFSVVATARSIRPVSDPEVLTVAGDISEAETAQRIMDIALERFGRIDTLVNNAGVFIAKPFTEYSAADYDSAVGVNLDGFFHVTRPAIDHMRGRGHGHVVNITTTLVEHASSSVPSALASLTKGGVAAATRSLAIEYAASGIRVNAVSPGVIKTSMHDPDAYEGLAQLHPLQRLGEIDDIVRGVLYLESSPFVTGEFLHIDGGQSAGH